MMSQLFEQLRQWVDVHPEKAAIIEDSISWTYADVAEKAIRFSDALAQRGIQPGDRVAIMMLNQKEFVVAFCAILRLGAVAVPINIQLPPDDIGYVLQNAGVRLLITTTQFASQFKNSPLPLVVVGSQNEALSFDYAVNTGHSDFSPNYQRHPDTLSVLIYTSGTTAKPKGVMLSEENLLSNMAGFADAVPFEPGDKMLLALPLFHSYGLIVSLYGFMKGLTQVFVPTFNPRQMVKTIAAEKITLLPLVPTIYSFLAEAIEKTGPEPFESLRMCISGGASLPSALLKKLEAAANITILEGYGLTETSPVVAVNRCDVGSIPGAVGPPLSNLQIRLVNFDGDIVSHQLGQHSDEGEVEVKGPNVMLGYYDLPDETRDVLTKDGWLKTGDIGRFDADGNLYLSGGRKKELIIKAGENISPLKIESVLYQHPAIAEACAFGFEDSRLGEDIAVAVRFKEGQDASDTELRAFCLDKLSPMMVPKYFKRYAELPKNATGKVLRKQLQADFDINTLVNA